MTNPSSVATTPPLYLDNDTPYDANSFRTFEAAATFFSLTGAQVYGGVICGGSVMKVTAAGGMNVQVDTGFAVVPSSTGSTYGGYRTGLLSVALLGVAASNATNPRIDLVCVTVSDTGSSSSSGYVQIITGSPASVPTAPSVPATSVALASVLVPATSTSVTTGNITNAYVQTAASGGIVPVPAIASAPAGYPGFYNHDRQTGILWHNSASGPIPVKTLPWATQYSVVTPASGNVGVGVAAGSQGTILTATVTTGGSTDIEISAGWPAIYALHNTGNGCAATFFLYIDGTKVGSFYAYNVADSGTTQGTAILHGGGTLLHTTSGANNPSDTPTAATHTITLQMEAFYTSGFDVWVYSQPGEPTWLKVKPAGQ